MKKKLGYTMMENNMNNDDLLAHLNKVTGLDHIFAACIKDDDAQEEVRNDKAIDHSNDGKI